MKKILFIFLFPSILFAQKGIDNLWMMGYECCATQFGGINIDFSSGSASISYINRKMSFLDISATMSDGNGKMLFYTNGIWIANANNDTMLNGSGLSPSHYTTKFQFDGLYIPQAALILPNPGDSLKYYLIHNTIDDPYFAEAYKIYYSEIDMTLDGGLGKVVSKNNTLLTGSLTAGKITGVKHANGRDWWLVFHQFNSDLYYLYLIDPSGINFYSSQHIGGLEGSHKAQTCFSPDGSKYAYYDPYFGLSIMDFDRCTGTFSNCDHINFNDSASGGGCAFSPNSSVLYVSSVNYVYQFNMNAADIPASKDTVAVYDGYYSPSPPLASIFYLSQLAPDGKIYINCSNSTLDIHVINHPDSLGLACDVCQHCVHLPAYNAFTIPNHPNYHLGALVGSPCDTVTSVIDNGQLIIDNKIQVFPNPVVNREVTFTYTSTAEIKTISVFNVEGKEVAQYTLPQWSTVQHVKLPELAHGVYLARIMGKEQSAKVKFVVE